jgi:hypothetical protein
VKEAHASSPTREIALTRLGSAKSDVAPQYLDLAKASGDPNRIPELIDLMRKMPDVNGRLLVFHEAYMLGKNSPEFRRSLIGRALETPGIGGRAIELLKPEEAAMFEPQLTRLARQTWDKPTQEKARNLLAELNAGTDVGRVISLLGSDNPRGVQKGLDIVIASKSADNRLIEPLVKLAATSPDATSRAARQALLRYNPQVVKYHAQNLRRTGVNASPEIWNSLMSR